MSASHLEPIDIGATAQNNTLSVLAVDDEPFVLSCLSRELRSGPFRVLTAHSGQEGLERLEECERAGELPAVVISDYRMPMMDGLTFLEQVKQRWPRIQRVLLTAYASPNVLEDAINRCQIHRFLNKPWDSHLLRSTLFAAGEQYRLLRLNSRLLEERALQNEKLRTLNETLERQVERRTWQLSAAKQELSTTFDAIGDPVILLDENFMILRANVALAHHSGARMDSLSGRRCHELIAGSSQRCEGCPVEKSLHTGRASLSRIVLSRRDVTFLVSAFPSSPGAQEGLGARRFVCLYRDITAQERTQRKLLLSQKMAALGELSGAVAHEINNPLGGILAFAQIMKREVSEETEEHEFLTCIEDSARRCQKTVRNLLNYARFSPREERDEVSMRTIVSKSAAITSHMLGLNSVTLEVRDDTPGAGDALVLVNSSEVQGVIINLIQNAADAMESTGGVLEVGFAIDRSVSPAIVITRVQDHGCGIEPEHLGRIFDPFFTTKEEGKGTGLGLSISYQIVQDNAGTIEAESVPGQGTTFLVSFPLLSRASRVS